MPLGTAIGAISLTGNSSAFPPPVPLSNILGVNDPFYAVKNLNPVTLDANNPSCRYSFTYRFRIPATASSVAKLEETVWCPGLVFRGLASGSANLSTFAYGSFYGRAFVTANLTGVSNGEVTVFAQVIGNAGLSSSSSAEVTVFAIASDSMVLTSSVESGTGVPAVADSLGPLVGDALATTIINAIADGEAILEGESEASVDVFAVAEAVMELTGSSESQVNVFAAAESSLELEGDSQATVVQEGVAEGDADLEGNSAGDITLLRAAATADTELDSDAVGILSRIEAIAEEDMELTSTLTGSVIFRDSSAESTFGLSSILNDLNISLEIQASTVTSPPPNASLSGDADGDVVESAFLINPYTWDFAVDHTASSIYAGSGTQVNDTGNANATTRNFSSGSIGSSRINSAKTGGSSEYVITGGLPFTTNDSLHYRFIGIAPFGSGSLSTNVSDVTGGNNPQTISISRTSSSQIRFFVQESTFFSNGFFSGWIIDTLAQPVIYTHTNNEELLIDINLFRSGTNLTYEFFVNGTQSSYTFPASERSHTPFWSSIDRFRRTGTTFSDFIFEGIRIGSNISFAQHQSDFTSSGI